VLDCLEWHNGGSRVAQSGSGYGQPSWDGALSGVERHISEIWLYGDGASEGKQNSCNLRGSFYRPLFYGIITTSTGARLWLPTDTGYYGECHGASTRVSSLLEAEYGQRCGRSVSRVKTGIIATYHQGTPIGQNHRQYQFPGGRMKLISHWPITHAVYKLQDRKPSSGLPHPP
jgi:hypothetical protein